MSEGLQLLFDLSVTVFLFASIIWTQKLQRRIEQLESKASDAQLDVHLSDDPQPF